MQIGVAMMAEHARVGLTGRSMLGLLHSPKHTLPQVTCLRGEFNQVILNFVVNAAHALSDVEGEEPQHKGVITGTTPKVDGWAEIRIADTGTGTPEDIKNKVFDPFFTAKEVRKGTGQGLRIAYAVIVDKHGGTIEVDSKPGRGTCLTIHLPLDVATLGTDARGAKN